MSNLKDARPKVTMIKLSDGVEREIKFTLNAMAELEDRYGSIDAAFEALENNSMKAVRCVLWAGLIHADESLTERQVGGLIDVQTMPEIIKNLTEAFGNDMPEDKQAPNASMPVVQPVAIQ